MQIGNEINEAYNKVEDLFKINLKRQINNSGLYFSELMEITDNSNPHKLYSLNINGKKVNFNSKITFYKELLLIIKIEMEEVKETQIYYDKQMSENIIYDEIFIYKMQETLGIRIAKLDNLKERIYKLIEKHK